jgi:hypothetical protein
VWYKIRKSNQLLIHLTSFWLFTLQLARFYSSVFIADQLTLGHYIVYSNPRLFAKLRAWYVIMMKSLCVWTRKISVRVQSVSFCWMHGFNNVVYWTDFNKIMKIIDEGCWCLTVQDLLVFCQCLMKVIDHCFNDSLKGRVFLLWFFCFWSL